MPSQDISIPSEDGTFSGYLAIPEAGSGPGLVVLQEIFGVNAIMRDICDDLAAHGFTALCPDLFWRIEPGIQLTDRSEQEWQRAFELFNAFDVDTGVKDIAAALSFLRTHSACSGKVGTIGFCLGGLLAYLSATRTDCDAAVGFYGVSIADRLAEAEKITHPLMLHIAGRDSFVPPEAQEAMKKGLGPNPLVTLHVYPEQEHAFARKGGEHYDEGAARAAFERSYAFLKEHLA